MRLPQQRQGVIRVGSPSYKRQKFGNILKKKIMNSTSPPQWQILHTLYEREEAAVV